MNITLFVAPTSTRLVTQTVETRVEIVAGKAGAITRLGIRVSSNSRSTATVLRVRKNGANGNNVISIAGRATGYFEDTTSSDSLAAGDTFCFALTGDSATGTLTVAYMSALLESAGGADDPAHNYYGVHGGTLINSSSSSDLYITPGGAGTKSSDTDRTRIPIPTPGTFSNMQTRVVSNAKTTPIVCRFRKNGANGNQTFTVGAGATGHFEDTTNADAVVQGDVVNMLWDVSGSGLVTVTKFYVMFVSDPATNATFLVGESGLGTSSDHFHPVAGVTDPVSREDRADVMLPYGFTFKNLYDRRSFGAAVHHTRFRKNAEDGNLDAASSGVPGEVTVSDLTNQDTTRAGDRISLRASPSGVFTTGRFVSIAVVDPGSAPLVGGRISLTHGA